MATCDPRRFRISSSGSRNRSRAEPFPFANRTSPAIRARGGSRRIRASEVTDFPDPDSPTRPRTSRGAMVKLRSRTAIKDCVEGEPWVGNPTARPRTSSSGCTRHILAGQMCLRALRSQSRDGLVWPYGLPSIVVWVFGWRLVVQEVLCVVRCWNFSKTIVLMKVETIREVVGHSIRISERRQMVNPFDELQNTAEIMGNVGDIALLRERRHDDQRHAKPVFIRVDDCRGNVVIPSSPIVPRDEDGSVVPILTAADGIDNRRNPGRSQTLAAPRMVRFLPGWNHPANVGELTVGDVG